MAARSSPGPALLRFAVFELDLQSGELRKAGIPVSLPPQPFKILAFLAGRGGELVTREEIQREVWGDEAVVDFERGLNFAINKIRAALGDNADTPRFVETLPRRGYRFLYPVERVDVPHNRLSEPVVAPAAGAKPPRSEAPETLADPQAPGRRERRWIAWTIALLAAVALGAWGWLRTPISEPRAVMRWTIALPGANPSPWLALSPDGAHLTDIGSSRQQIIVRSLDQNESKMLAGTEDAGEPQFSPDAQWILYLAKTSLKKVPVGGGPSTTIASVPSSSYGLSWAEDGTILVGQGAGGILRVPSSGGTPTALTTIDSGRGEVCHAWPVALPGAKAALLTINRGSYDDAEIAVLDLRSGKYRVLMKGGAHAVYVPTGHLVYARSASLFAVPFDVSILCARSCLVIRRSDWCQDSLRPGRHGDRRHR